MAEPGFKPNSLSSESMLRTTTFYCLINEIWNCFQNLEKMRNSELATMFYNQKKGGEWLLHNRKYIILRQHMHTSTHSSPASLHTQLKQKIQETELSVTQSNNCYCILFCKKFWSWPNKGLKIQFGKHCTTPGSALLCNHLFWRKVL